MSLLFFICIQTKDDCILCFKPSKLINWGVMETIWMVIQLHTSQYSIQCADLYSVYWESLSFIAHKKALFRVPPAPSFMFVKVCLLWLSCLLTGFFFFFFVKLPLKMIIMWTCVFVWVCGGHQILLSQGLQMAQGKSLALISRPG